MPSSSQMKKEEAELRKIAKQSRQSQKEAKARERKQSQQQQRRKAALTASTADATTSDAKNAVVASTSTDSTRLKRKGAVILPEEVADLRRRLFMDETAKSPTAPMAPRSKKGEKRKGTQSARQTPAASLPVSSRPVPPYSVELHHKNKQILVDVTLHHIPAAHIDVSETTSTKLVVDVSKHTKRYRLELPMPEGIRIDAENTSCELDSSCGVLRCVLPIQGDIPPSLVEEREKMLDTIRKQKTLRFRMDADGELRVRSRQALLAKSQREQAALVEARTNGASKRPREEKETTDEAKTNEPLTKTKGKKETKAPKGKTTPKDNEKEEEENNANDAGKAEQSKPLKKKAKLETPATGMRSSKPETHHASSTSSKKERGTVFAEEHKRAMELAKAAGKASQLSLRASIARAKALQQKRLERTQVRAERREVRSEKAKHSFTRVLEEQRQQLRARAELLASAKEAEKAATERRRSGKVVSFALNENGENTHTKREEKQ